MEPKYVPAGQGVHEEPPAQARREREGRDLEGCCGASEGRVGEMPRVAGCNTPALGRVAQTVCYFLPCGPAGLSRSTPGLGSPPGLHTGVLDRQSASPQSILALVVVGCTVGRTAGPELPWVDHRGRRHCKTCVSRPWTAIWAGAGRRKAGSEPILRGPESLWQAATPQ